LPRARGFHGRAAEGLSETLAKCRRSSITTLSRCAARAPCGLYSSRPEGDIRLSWRPCQHHRPSARLRIEVELGSSGDSRRIRWAVRTRPSTGPTCRLRTSRYRCALTWRASRALRWVDPGAPLLDLDFPSETFSLSSARSTIRAGRGSLHLSRHGSACPPWRLPRTLMLSTPKRRRASGVRPRRRPARSDRACGGQAARISEACGPLAPCFTTNCTR